MRSIPIINAATPSAVTTVRQRTDTTWWSSFRTPTVADAVFVVVVLYCLQLGASRFFIDPGIGWHLRTGGNIVAAGAVPITDTFSYTRGGSPWVETQWLADVLMSLAYGAGGYALIALGVAVILAALFRCVYRTHLSNGGWPVTALLVTLVGAYAASGHFLARPLVASTIGIPLCFWWATQYARGTAGTRRLWLLVPIAALWCNLHPGVLGGVATVALCGIALCAEVLITRATRSRPEALRRGITLLAVSAAMGAATLVNPYGLAWHQWIVGVMDMGLARYVQEWMPPIWSNPDTIATAMLLAAVVIGVAVRRKGTSPAETLIILFWITQAVQSRRHAPLLAMILAIQLGRVLADVRVVSPRWKRIGASVPLFSSDIRDAELRAGGGLVSIAGAVLLAVLLIGGTTVPALGLGVAGPPETKYSFAAIDYLRTHPPTERIFNTTRYGGTLIRDLPEVPVFIDDRFGLYGREFVEAYLAVGRKPQDNAAELFDRWRIDTVLIGTSAPLYDWLVDTPEWTEVYRDDIAAVYTRPPTWNGNARDTH